MRQGWPQIDECKQTNLRGGGEGQKETVKTRPQLRINSLPSIGGGNDKN